MAANKFTFSIDLDIASVPIILSGAYTSGTDGDLTITGNVAAPDVLISDVIKTISQQFGVSGGLDIHLLPDITNLIVAVTPSTDTFVVTGDFELEGDTLGFKLQNAKAEGGKTNTAFIFNVDVNESASFALPIPSNIPVLQSGLSDNLKVSFDSIIIATASTEVGETTYKPGILFTGSAGIFDYTKDLQIYLYEPKPADEDKASGDGDVKADLIEETQDQGAISNNSTNWFVVNKTLGPINLEKVGFQFNNGNISLLVDASAALAGIDFSVEGLELTVPLTFPPSTPVTFGLNGISLSYTGEEFDIGGSFLKSSTESDYYSGLAYVDTKEISVNAFGGYGEDKKGDSSLFIFASVDVPLGGPAIFFVTGLSLGFGYNMSITVPTKASDVPDYPLLKTKLFNGLGAGDVSTALQILNKNIYPSPNDYWFAIGIQFSSFDLISSNYLLSVDIKKEIIAIIGVSSLVLPKGDDNPFLNVALGIIISYNIKEGVLEASAAIATGSYVLDKDCKVFGAFAFFAWFKDLQQGGIEIPAGTFVLSLGGYNPHFNPPSYFPAVQRVGFEWKIGSVINIGGETYFALTPSAVMAGIKFHLIFTAGPLKAWLKADADFLIQWKPFYYNIYISINIGASISVFKLDMGASLQIDGPPFAGYVHIDWIIISFTIKFGNKADKTPILDWADYQTSFLPDVTYTKPASKLVATVSGANRISIANGLSNKLETTSGYNTINQSADTWVVRARNLELSTQSKIPVKSFTFGSGSKPATVSSVSGTIAALGIRPMALTDIPTCEHNISFTGPVQGATHRIWNDPSDVRTWAFETQSMAVPEAQWSPAPVNPKIPNANTINAIVGYSSIKPVPYVPSSDYQANIQTFLAEYIYKKIYLSSTTDLIAYGSADESNPIEYIMENFSTLQSQRSSVVNDVNALFGLTGKDLITENISSYVDGDTTLEVELYFQAIPVVGELFANPGSLEIDAEDLNAALQPATPPTADTACSFALSGSWLYASNTTIYDYTDTQKGYVQAADPSPTVYIYPGISFLFAMVNPNALQTSLDYTGTTNRIQVLAFDEYYNVVACKVTSSVYDQHEVGTKNQNGHSNNFLSQLFIMGLNPAVSGGNTEVHGWSRDNQIAFANPYAAIGAGFIMKPRVHIQPNITSPSLISSILNDNVLTGNERGWIDTTFLINPTVQIVVLVQPIGTGTTAAFDREFVQGSIPYLLTSGTKIVNKTYSFAHSSNCNPINNDVGTTSFAQSDLSGLCGVMFDISSLDLPEWLGLVFRGQIVSTKQSDYQIYGVYGLTGTPGTDDWKTSIDYFAETNSFKIADGDPVALSYTE